MFRPSLALALLALTSSPLVSQGVQNARVASADSHLRWQLQPNGSGDGQLTFSREGDHGSINTSHGFAIVGEEAVAALASPGAAIAFSVEREPGVLHCHGKVSDNKQAAGTCAFTADQTFLGRIMARGLAPRTPDDLIGAALVDVRLSQVDDLKDLGYKVGKFSDMIAIAALQVTPGYAIELRQARLAFTKLDDLIAAKAVGVTLGYVTDVRSSGLRLEDADDIISARAVGVDRPWLQAMAEAGYDDLDVEQAIQLKALGVTADYAIRMARVIEAVGE